MPAKAPYSALRPARLPAGSASVGSPSIRRTQSWNKKTSYSSCISTPRSNGPSASRARYRRAPEAAGFTGVRLVGRDPWHREEARREQARLSGPDRPAFERMLGEAEVAGQIRTWSAMLPVLDSGEHCPHHLRGRKPG